MMAVRRGRRKGLWLRNRRSKDRLRGWTEERAKLTHSEAGSCKGCPEETRFKERHRWLLEVGVV